jgi:hypothetical protein
MGCLSVFGRLVAQLFYGLGSLLSSILVRGASFVLATIVGPLWLGSMRELVIRALGITHGGRPIHAQWDVSNRVLFSLLSGLVWVAAFFVLRAVWQLMTLVLSIGVQRMSPELPGWVIPCLVATAVFCLGAAVGRQIHGGRADAGVIR